MHNGRSLIVTLGLAAGGLVATVGPAVPAFASSQVCAGIVIDDGSGAAPVPQGASAPVGSSDLDLLSAAGDTFTQNSSGLVCAINGYPANGLQNCLGASHGLYYYWSYWEGDPATNEWTYADVGPAEHTVTAGQPYVEGWRYQDPGPDSPEATKPSVKPAAAFAQACDHVTSTTTTSTDVPGGDGSAVPPTAWPVCLRNVLPSEHASHRGKDASARDDGIEPRGESARIDRDDRGRAGIGRASTGRRGVLLHDVHVHRREATANICPVGAHEPRPTRRVGR